MKRKLEEYEEPPTSVNELWEHFQDEWDGIEPSVCQNLIESMPRRIEAVLRAKGGYTKYSLMQFSFLKNGHQKTIAMTWVTCKLHNITKNGYMAYIIGRFVNEILTHVSNIFVQF